MMSPCACAHEVEALGPGEIRSLVSIGFHGLLNGQHEPALRLFEALQVLRPLAPFPLIGSALSMIAAGRADEAARVLERAHALLPQDDDVRVFLGMTLRIASRGHQARAVLGTLVGSDSDTPAVRLARRLCNSPP
jgi:Flp pilus assembly protein TadD